MQNVNIRLIREEDISSTAKVYKTAFNRADVGEKWTLESAEKLIEFLFKFQPDLFFVAEFEGKILGGAVGLIKPFWNGNYITETELFVNPEFQNQGIGKELLKKLISEALNKYNITSFDGLAYKNRKFPLAWYQRIGLKESDKLVYLEGNPKEIIEKL